MFNSKQKIVSLEDAVRRQGILLAEKESELRLMQQKMAYAEGRLDASKEMIHVLKEQLKEETTRFQELQKTFILQQAINHDKFSESMSTVFEEDRDTVLKMHQDMKDTDEGEL